MLWPDVNGKSGLSGSANYCKYNTLKKFQCVISGFRCEVDETGPFCVITQRVVVVTDVSGQPIGLNFKGLESKKGRLLTEGGDLSFRLLTVPWFNRIGGFSNGHLILQLGILLTLPILSLG